VCQPRCKAQFFKKKKKECTLCPAKENKLDKKCSRAPEHLDLVHVVLLRAGAAGQFKASARDGRRPVCHLPIVKSIRQGLWPSRSHTHTHTSAVLPSWSRIIHCRQRKVMILAVSRHVIYHVVAVQRGYL